MKPIKFKKLKIISTHIYMVSKSAGVVENHTFRVVPNLVIDFVT